MQSFWRLLNIIISVIGFLIAGGLALFREDPFEIIVLKAVGAFVLLYYVQNTMGSILLSVCGTTKIVDRSAANDAKSDAAVSDINKSN